MLFRVDAATAEDAKFVHGGLDRGEETENSKGYRYTHPKTGRLLQESDESCHAFSVPPSEEVTSQTTPVHLSGDCTATHTRSNNPEGAF